MSEEYGVDHEHELEAEYLSPRDAEVLDLYERGDSLYIDVVVQCPTCSESLRLSGAVEEVVESDVEFPIEDLGDIYD